MHVYKITFIYIFVCLFLKDTKVHVHVYLKIIQELLIRI